MRCMKFFSRPAQSDCQVWHSGLWPTTIGGVIAKCGIGAMAYSDEMSCTRDKVRSYDSVC